jgi:hypothetical protein
MATKNAHYRASVRSVKQHLKKQIAALRAKKKSARSSDDRTDLQAAINALNTVHRKVQGMCEMMPGPGR